MLGSQAVGRGEAASLAQEPESGEGRVSLSKTPAAGKQSPQSPTELGHFSELCEQPQCAPSPRAACTPASHGEGEPRPWSPCGPPPRPPPSAPSSTSRLLPPGAHERSWGGHLLGEGPGPPAQHGSPLHVPSHGTPLLPEPTQAWAGILLRRSMAKDQSPVCALEKLEMSHQGRRPGAPEVWVTALMTQGRGGRRRGGPSPESSRGPRDLPLPPWGAL